MAVKELISTDRIRYSRVSWLPSDGLVFCFPEVIAADQIGVSNCSFERVVWHCKPCGLNRKPVSEVIGCLLALASVLWSTRTLTADTIPEIVAKAKSAVVQIITLDQNRQPFKTGTGFFVSGDGYLLTNNHVIDGGSYFTARTSSGATYTFESVVSGPQIPTLQN